jgi:hypothetical protein
MAGPAERGYEIMTVFLLFLALTTISCALRVYCRVYIQKAFGWDDKFAVFAWVSEFIHPNVDGTLRLIICAGMLDGLHSIVSQWHFPRDRTT